jgi:hypothetical protein
MNPEETKKIIKLINLLSLKINNYTPISRDFRKGAPPKSQKFMKIISFFYKLLDFLENHGYFLPKVPRIIHEIYICCQRVYMKILAQIYI